MLTFDIKAIHKIVKDHRRTLNRINSIQRINNSWGCGPNVDKFTGLQGAFVALLGRSDRTPGRYPRDSGAGTTSATNEYFHPIIRIRRFKLQNYDPLALQGVYSTGTP